MVRLNSEGATINILVEMFYPKDDGQGFLIQLGVFPFCWCKGSRGISDGSFRVIHAVRQDGP